MKDSSRSERRLPKSSRRVRDRGSRARRLGIESMEGRVLLSGNTLDLSTFGADLTAASYAPPVAVTVADSTAPIAPYFDSTRYLTGSLK